MHTWMEALHTDSAEFAPLLTAVKCSSRYFVELTASDLRGVSEAGSGSPQM
jgi:hypothetical protein